MISNSVSRIRRRPGCYSYIVSSVMYHLTVKGTHPPYRPYHENFTGAQIQIYETPILTCVYNSALYLDGSGIFDNGLPGVDKPGEVGIATRQSSPLDDSGALEIGYCKPLVAYRSMGDSR
jgi:hypothetical protein